MNKLNLLIIFFCFNLFIITGQNTKTQLIGRVVDINTSKGIEGVEVQLLSTGDLFYTDSEGKFKFIDSRGFIIGEPNYSFIIQKEGYLTVGNTNNMVMFGSGTINNLAMKPDLEKFLWLVLKNGRTGEFIKNATVDILGNTKQTNSLGKVSYDYSKYGNVELKVSIKKECFKDLIVKLSSSKGEKEINMIPTCNKDDDEAIKRDPLKASQILDRALKSRNGSKQGQVKALEFLKNRGYDFN